MARVADRLDSLALFISIAERHGLAAAGREHGLSPTSVSERLAALESAYGARLVNRTTRSLSLTDAGERLLDGARHLMAEADALEARVRDDVERLSGTIRIGAPVDFGRACLAPMLARFQAAHPGVVLDLDLHDGFSDLVGHRLDLAIRRGTLEDSSLIARRLASNHRRVCASPAYAERHGLPVHPDELAAHDCLLMRFGTMLDNGWHFRVDEQDVRVVVRGSRIANDGGLVREWCLAGHGLAYKSEWDVQADLSSGALLTCLDEFAVEPSSVQLVYPSAERQPLRVKALIEHLLEAFAEQTPPIASPD